MEQGLMTVKGTKRQLDIALKDIPLRMIQDGQIKGGDTKVVWNKDNQDEIEVARNTFNSLKSKGYTAFSVLKGGDKGEQIQEFNPNAQGLIMVPPMRGGC